MPSFFQGLTVTASNKLAKCSNPVSIFLLFFFPCSFFIYAYQTLASPKMKSLSCLSGRVHAEVGGNSPGLLQTVVVRKKLELDHQDVSHARLPCVRNEYTMRNKHFCCVLNWSGHDILKLRVMLALLWQRQIVNWISWRGTEHAPPVLQPGSLWGLALERFCAIM